MTGSRIMNRGTLVGAIGVGTILVGSMGAATAANGGSLTLGHNNKATATTTVTDKKGTPLSLIGRRSKPPLQVNSTKRVKHLNADLLDGYAANTLPPSDLSASAFVDPAGGMVKAYTHNFTAMHKAGIGTYCLVPAATVLKPKSTVAMVTVEYELSSGNDLRAYVAEGDSDCPAGDYVVLTRDSSGPTDNVAFQIWVP
jgi:hypothetical protein